MTTIDLLMYYTMYRPALGKFVCALPLPKHMKRDFVFWQARGMIGLAIKKIEDECKARMKA